MQRISLLLLGALLIVSASATALMSQTNTVVTFDNPAPVGSPDGILNGIFQGIDFGTGQWRWSAPLGSDFSNSIYFDSSVGTSRSFSFPSGRRILNAVNVYALESGTLSLSDDAGQTLTRPILVGSVQLVTTGWSLPSNTVTFSFSAGWSLGVDDIAYTEAVPSDNEPPVISISSPSSGSAVSGTVPISASASDNSGVFGVQFLVDGVKFGTEDTTAPYLISWNTTSVASGSHTLTAVARDDAGNQSISSPVTIIVDNMPGGNPNYTLRFFGGGVNDIDRVKIQIDNPANSAPGPPADVGATDFTVEFWMRAGVGENAAAAVECGNNKNWIFGNIVIDRDRFNQGRSFGLSLAGGRFVFGVSGDGPGDRTICGATNVLDD
ncbi:MAG TPA: Ig-like domain-containing protein, partial [Terriglobia bacterium]|nr:Ig-like domain-containing protein [Terriglobia bacterium]